MPFVRPRAFSVDYRRFQAKREILCRVLACLTAYAISPASDVFWAKTKPDQSGNLRDLDRLVEAVKGTTQI